MRLRSPPAYAVNRLGLLRDQARSSFSRNQVTVPKGFARMHNNSRRAALIPADHINSKS
jgi:hypothetical protein